jgi:hypothetical protein
VADGAALSMDGRPSCDNSGMKRIVLCVSAVALALGLGTPWWSSSPAMAADPPKAPAAAKATNASCALVTKAEAEAILGEPLDDLTSPQDHTCDYGHKPNRPHLFMTELRTSQTKSSFESGTKAAAKAMRATVKPVAGYGEAAVWIGTFQIVVLQHGKALSVAMPGPKVAPAKLDAFLRKAISRM